MDLKQEAMLKIVNDKNYYKWLHDVTNLHPLIYDIGWGKFPADLKELNTFNFQGLKYLYELIEDYAKSKAIAAFPNIESEYYLINYRDDFYKIYQIKATIGIVTFCQRIKTNNKEYYEEDEFLNIENILNPSSKELKKIKE